MKQNFSLKKCRVFLSCVTKQLNLLRNVLAIIFSFLLQLYYVYIQRYKREETGEKKTSLGNRTGTEWGCGRCVLQLLLISITTATSIECGRHNPRNKISNINYIFIYIYIFVFVCVYVCKTCRLGFFLGECCVANISRFQLIFPLPVMDVQGGGGGGERGG